MTDHRYWRLYIPENSGNTNYTVIGDIEFRGIVGGSDLTDPTTALTAAFAQSYITGSEPYVAFNDVRTVVSASASAVYWSTESSRHLGTHVGYDFGDGNEVDINEVALFANRETTRLPNSLYLQYSDDGVEWFTKGGVTNQTGWTLGELRLFDFTPSLATNYQVFREDGEFIPPPGINKVSVLIVAGGGGGRHKATGNLIGGPGGGAGGVLLKYNYVVTPEVGISVVIGKGGSGGLSTGTEANSGENSSFGSLVAVGGGRGGSGTSNGAESGGSGGGGSFTTPAATDGVPGQGNKGGLGTGNASGSGGGYKSPGNNVSGNSGAAGGLGINVATTIFGSFLHIPYMAAGGSSGNYGTGNPIPGSSSVGGVGGSLAGSILVEGGDGVANTGSGGGGCGGGNSSLAGNGGSGGSGIVVVVWGDLPEAGPLDGLDASGAWSLSRNLLSNFSGDRYTDNGGFASALADHTMNSRNMVQATSTRQPAIVEGGPADRLCVDFDNTDDYMSSVAASNFIQNSVGYMVVSFIPENAPGSSGTYYNNDGILADSGGYLGIYFGGPGSSPEFYRLTNYNYDGNADYATVADATKLGDIRVVEWLHQNSTISIRINGGTWVSVASGNTSNRGNELRLGHGYGQVFGGKIFEALTFYEVPGPAIRDAIVSDLVNWLLGDTPPAEIPAVVTQLPVIVSGLFNPPARVTQLPVIISFLEYRASYLTQLPIQVAYSEKPVPLPKSVIPEVPVKETWSWKTALKEIYNGKEQRARLREYPRYKLNFTALILDDQDRLDVYALLMRYLKQKFIYPIYHYNAFLTAPSSAGSTELYVATQETDLRVGEKLALFDPQLRTISYYTVSAVASDKVTVVEPLVADASVNFQVFPAYEFRLGSEAGFTMRNVAGDFEVTMESVSDRSFLTPSANPSVTTKDGLLVVPEKYLTDDSPNEDFIMGVDWVDNDTSLPENFNRWSNPMAKGTRTYKFDRRSKIHYWRKVADLLKGRQGVALFPTFRSDIDLREAPAPGSSTLVTNNTEFIKYWSEPNYRYVRIETTSGAVSYNKILDVVSLYDSDGYPYASQVKFESVLPSQIKLVSFMNMCRLDSDSVELTHYEVDSEIKFSIRAVNG